MSCDNNSNRSLRAAAACGVSSAAGRAAFAAGRLADKAKAVGETSMVVGGMYAGAITGGLVGGSVGERGGGVGVILGSSLGATAGAHLGAKAGEVVARAQPANKAGLLGSAVGGVLGGPPGYLVGSALGNRIGRQQRQSRVKPGPGGALYDDQTLNLRAGVDLSATFGGAYLSTASLQSAVSDRDHAGQLRPLVKLGGENDLFTAEGPRGQIAFTLPDGTAGPARIEGIIPARGREAELTGALDGRLPKYVITDEETGDVYATRNPYEARQFSKALNQTPEEAVLELQPGETGFDVIYKDVPDALFY
ncbi:MAG: hypothetical protein Kow0031_24790 [Anaerolineae bacterium]